MSLLVLGGVTDLIENIGVRRPAYIRHKRYIRAGEWRSRFEMELAAASERLRRRLSPSDL